MNDTRVRCKQTQSKRKKKRQVKRTPTNALSLTSLFHIYNYYYYYYDDDDDPQHQLIGFRFLWNAMPWPCDGRVLSTHSPVVVRRPSPARGTHTHTYHSCVWCRGNGLIARTREEALATADGPYIFTADAWSRPFHTAAMRRGTHTHTHTHTCTPQLSTFTSHSLARTHTTNKQTDPNKLVHIQTD